MSIWLNTLDENICCFIQQKPKLHFKHKLFLPFIWDSEHTCTIAGRILGPFLSDISWRETSVALRTKTLGAEQQ